ncbi:hypothetical protein DAETH_20400 [Deinococcus aetherius]|uniref:OmpR/PhoB-type domain-containing protein n=1 Tax=Deinococcus aetherius TaxID=200252 RepID=A0ABM8AE58_9DEIO|nr:winged helix-turn-helix domain-containing protein [Deinococcus aetherius]BDP42071.1 hypothetical protein DAETH_20400 [Deinococcus aetherius]
MSGRGRLGTPGALTAREQALFDLLSRHRGRLFSRAEIVERVWGVSFEGDDRIVDVYVKRIRRKLREDVIETVRGGGYRRPERPDGRQALPHFAHLSADARTLLDLGRRVLGASTPRAVLSEVQAVLARSLRVTAVAVLRAPSAGAGAGWEVQEACGDDRADWGALPVPEATGPVYLGVGGWARPRAAALLPLVGPGVGHWATLAALAEPGTVWDAGARAQLEAVAALVNSALRLCLETGERVRAQQELQALNAELERRVQRRTEALARAGAEHETLNELSRRLERARGVAGLLAVSLPVLARLAGTNACAAWLPGRGGAPACFRADGTPGTLPDPGHPADLPLHLEAGGEEVTLHPFDEAGRPPGPGEASPLLPTAVGSVTLTLSRLLYLEALEAAALTDEDTGLGNRQAFLADLTGEVAYSARHGTGFGLALVEIANIRSLNATVGYAGGNDMILRLAATLRETRRAEDRVYRLNGATFAVLLRFPPQAAPTPAQALEGWRERLRPVLAGLARHAPFPLELCTSQVSCPEDAHTTSDLLRLALDRLAPGLPGAPHEGRPRAPQG